MHCSSETEPSLMCAAKVAEGAGSQKKTERSGGGWWDDKKPAVSSSAADLVGYAPLSSSRTGEETRTPRTGAGEEPRLHTEEALGPALAR